jgi:hypothetical protein
VTPTLSVAAGHVRVRPDEVTLPAVGCPGALGAWVSPGLGFPPPFTAAENEFTARPAPPIQGSKPAWMLVRYHELVTAPRARTSAMKSSTLNDQLEIGDGATYEITFQPMLPRHTSHVRPPIVVLPTGEPMGWIEPWRLNQIMISVAF